MSPSENLYDFFAMGGYATYVWPSYAIFMIVLLANFIYPIWLKKQIMLDLKRKQKLAARRMQENAE